MRCRLLTKLVEAARSEFSADPGIISPLSKALHFSNIFADRSFHTWVDLKAKFCFATLSRDIFEKSEYLKFCARFGLP